MTLLLANTSKIKNLLFSMKAASCRNWYFLQLSVSLVMTSSPLRLTSPPPHLINQEVAGGVHHLALSLCTVPAKYHVQHKAVGTPNDTSAVLTIVCKSNIWHLCSTNFISIAQQSDFIIKFRIKEP